MFDTFRSLRIFGPAQEVEGSDRRSGWGYPCQRRGPSEQYVSIEWQRTGCTARPLDPYPRAPVREFALIVGLAQGSPNYRSEDFLSLFTGALQEMLHAIARTLSRPSQIELTASEVPICHPSNRNLSHFAHRLSAGPDFRVSRRPLSPFISCQNYTQRSARGANPINKFRVADPVPTTLPTSATPLQSA